MGKIFFIKFKLLKISGSGSFFHGLGFARTRVHIHQINLTSSMLHKSQNVLFLDFAFLTATMMDSDFNEATKDHVVLLLYVLTFTVRVPSLTA